MMRVTVIVHDEQLVADVDTQREWICEDTLTDEQRRVILTDCAAFNQTPAFWLMETAMDMLRHAVEDQTDG